MRAIAAMERDDFSKADSDDRLRAPCRCLAQAGWPAPSAAAVKLTDFQARRSARCGRPTATSLCLGEVRSARLCSFSTDKLPGRPEEFRAFAASADASKDYWNQQRSIEGKEKAPKTSPSGSPSPVRTIGESLPRIAAKSLVRQRQLAGGICLDEGNPWSHIFQRRPGGSPDDRTCGGSVRKIAASRKKRSTSGMCSARSAPPSRASAFPSARYRFERA